MKACILGLVLVFVSLFVLTTFISYAPAIETARAAGFNDTDIRIGAQYGFERRLFMWAAVSLELGLLISFALTPLARRLADRALAWTGQRRVLAVLMLGFGYWALHAMLYLPIGIASLNHSWAWETTERTFASWLHDYAIASVLALVTEAILITGLYALLIGTPRIWWLVAPIGGCILATFYAMLLPVVISPLFNDFTLLEETQWRDQQPRLQKLINNAGLDVQGILVMNGSRQSNHSNAYFAGFGPTRRIVLFDTLLKNSTPDEIESVLGHELGHWKYDHINKGILLGTLAALVGCYLLHRFLLAARARAPWQLTSIADPAGLPLVMLLVFLGSWIAMPVGNLVSRHFERQADHYSLELADVPKAFIDEQFKLARVNKSNVAPSPWNVWLFATHPPDVERIQMAKDWRPKK